MTKPKEKYDVVESEKLLNGSHVICRYKGEICGEIFAPPQMPRLIPKPTDKMWLAVIDGKKTYHSHYTAALGQVKEQAYKDLPRLNFGSAEVILEQYKQSKEYQEKHGKDHS